MLPPLLLSVGVPTKLAIFWRAHLASAASTDPPRRDTLSLLVIRLDGLGGVVLTTPLFRELKRAFPDQPVSDRFEPSVLRSQQRDAVHRLALQPGGHTNI